MKRQWKLEPAKPKNKLLIGFIIGSIIMSIASVFVAPAVDPVKYQQIQAIGRKDIKQDDIQPGNMKVWRDPFDRDK